MTFVNDEQNYIRQNYLKDALRQANQLEHLNAVKGPYHSVLDYVNESGIIPIPNYQLMSGYGGSSNKELGYEKQLGPTPNFLGRTIGGAADLGYPEPMSQKVYPYPHAPYVLQNQVYEGAPGYNIPKYTDSIIVYDNKKKRTIPTKRKFGQPANVDQITEPLTVFQEATIPSTAPPPVNPIALPPNTDINKINTNVLLTDNGGINSMKGKGKKTNLKKILKIIEKSTKGSIAGKQIAKLNDEKNIENPENQAVFHPELEEMVIEKSKAKKKKGTGLDTSAIKINGTNYRGGDKVIEPDFKKPLGAGKKKGRPKKMAGGAKKKGRPSKELKESREEDKQEQMKESLTDIKDILKTVKGGAKKKGRPSKALKESRKEDKQEQMKEELGDIKKITKIVKGKGKVEPSNNWKELLKTVAKEHPELKGLKAVIEYIKDNNLYSKKEEKGAKPKGGAKPGNWDMILENARKKKGFSNVAID